MDTTGRDAYNVSRTVEGTDACLKVGLDKHGITNPSTLYRNLTYQELFEHEQKNNEGVVAKAEYGDTFTVDTGKYTGESHKCNIIVVVNCENAEEKLISSILFKFAGRSPKDRWIVLNPGSKSAENIDWNEINMATTPEVFDELYEKAVAHFNTKDKAYVFDGYCGARKDSSRLKVRFIHEMSWQQVGVCTCIVPKRRVFVA